MVVRSRSTLLGVEGTMTTRGNKQRHDKNIRRFRKGENIKLPHFDLPATIAGEPYTDENGQTFVPITIPGFRHSQMLRFDSSEEFEFEYAYYD